MSLIRIEHNPSRRQLITFGACWFVFIGAAGFILLDRGVPVTIVAMVWAIAIGIPLLGLFIPEVLRWCFIGLSYLTFPIGFFLSHLILGVVYYLVLTPVGLLMRILGYDPLGRRFEVQAQTYWLPREKPAEMKRYFRQF